MPLMFSPVNWLKPTIALLLAALWVPLTSHCELDRLPGFGFLACVGQDGDQQHSDKDCTTDLSGVVESDAYKIEEQPIALLEPVLLLMVVTCPIADELNTPPCCSDLTDSAPPELPRLWQFSFRTALPPRAPSLAS